MKPSYSVRSADSQIHIRDSVRKNLSRMQALTLGDTSSRDTEMSRRNATVRL